MAATVKRTLQGIAGPARTSSAAATAYLFTGPTSGIVGQNLVYTLTPNGSTTAVVTPASTGSGTFTPTTVTLNGTTPVTFVYQPSAAGTVTLSVTNGGGLSNPSSISLNVAAATNARPFC